MSGDLHILLLEDRAADAELMIREVRGEGIACSIQRVWTREDFLLELRTRPPDLVLADYALPAYDGLSALKVAQAEFPEVPFIFVSGTLGEERAIEALQHGATDYVLKQRMGRLGPAVRRALRGIEEVRERRRAERELRDEKALYHSLVEHLPQCVYRMDREGRFTYANHHFCAFLGSEDGAVPGKTWADYFPPDVADRLRESDDRVMRTETLYRAMEEFQQADRAGSVVQVVKSPVRSASGEIVGVQGIYTDITDQRELEAKFLRAQRLESIGSLASGIAHDLNNILTPILICAPLLRTESSVEESLKLLATIEASTRRAVDVVKQLLTIGRGRDGDDVSVQIGYIAREIAKIIRETFPRSIQVHEDVAADLWPVVGNPTQIHQVLLNLCINARDAMPAGGTLGLGARNLVIDQHFATMHRDASPGPFVCLRVADTGTGIPDSIRERVFDAFFTTKDAEHGTGLGLTTVLGIVKKHRGFITLTTSANRGTTFEVHLPAQPDAEDRRTIESADGTLPCGRGETVLVVEDEEPIRAATRLTLERHGYRVLEAPDGIEALAQFHAQPGLVRAVFTDLEMPKMDGWTLSRILRRLSQELPIIVSTGMAAESLGGHHAPPLSDLAISHVLHKPHNAAALLTALHGALAPAASRGA